MKHITLIGILSREHGGLTRAAFRRSTALSAIGENVEVLCFNVIPDFVELADHVRRHSEVGDVPLRNFFHDLSTPAGTISKDSAVRAKLRLTTHEFHPTDGLVVTETDFETPSQSFRFRHYTDEKGVLTRVDYIDRNDKVFFVDERKANTGRPRRMTLLNRRSGKILYQGGNYAFQTAWIDTQVGEEQAALGIDGASVATALSSYSRPNVQKNYFIHALHTEKNANPISGQIRKDRVESFRSNRTLDNIVCLTRLQAQHVSERLKPACAIRVMPNVIPPATAPPVERDPNLCVIVSRIAEGQKRLALWLQAFAIARKANPKLHAEVFGGPLKGDSWDTLSRTLDDLNLRDCVQFRGHKEGAADEFSRAGFTAMTSREEGFGMTLVEAMRRGAVPVSLDINYGPNEIITDSKDGFLVADGEIEEFAAAMVKASRLSDESMRSAAVESAQRFSPETIARRYLDIVDDTWPAKITRGELATVEAKISAISYEGNEQRVRAACTWGPGVTPEISGVELLAVDHHSLIAQTVPAAGVRFNHDEFEAEFVLHSELFVGLGGRDITGWVRLHADDTKQDLRPRWPDSWHGWPGRSPSGQFNLR